MFTAFDPLKAKQATDSDVAANALKREISNILNSYVGWYDPFSELIQNALDSVEERAKEKIKGYVPTIRICIDISANQLIVSDNGIGLDRRKFQQFLAPNFSFKSGTTRGHKGVGATYLAYGFNFIQICTKTPEYTAVGKMTGARTWLTDPSPSGNPQVEHDSSGPIDKDFQKFDRGVSICVRFDNHSHPRQLSWLKADKADQWHKILSVKTGLGAFFSNPTIKITLIVIASDGKRTVSESKGVEYFWPHQIVKKAKPFQDIKSKMDSLFKKHGKDFRVPTAFENLDAFYGNLTPNDITSLCDPEPDEAEIIASLEPHAYFCYLYSAKVWNSFNDSLKVRGGVSILSGGTQIAANNMPQGEVIQIPLKRNIGRQHQVHFVIHFANCTADLGRKGFRSEIVDFCNSITKRLIEGPLGKLHSHLRPVTGASPDIAREEAVEEWKKEMEAHEKSSPLVLKNENFFLPTRKVSLTSTPTREQDVIALFNQLLAGGVIRGVKIMSTNEYFTYDGMYRISFEPPVEHHIYDQTENPLGVEAESAHAMVGRATKARILEYKYSLNGLIEDLEEGSKNSNDIALVVVWETGEDYLSNYHITSLLDPDNLSLRQYHGVTHAVTNVTTRQREFDLIVLSELIDYLNSPKKTISAQRRKYEEE